MTLPSRGPLRTPKTQTLPLDVHAVSTASNPCVEVLSQSLGRAEQMGHTALPEPLPGLRDKIPTASTKRIVRQQISVAGVG